MSFKQCIDNIMIDLLDINFGSKQKKKNNNNNNLYCLSFLTLYTQPRLLTTLKRKIFENIVGKGENAGNQHFLLYPQCFLFFPKRISIFL